MLFAGVRPVGHDLDAAFLNMLTDAPVFAGGGSNGDSRDTVSWSLPAATAKDLVQMRCVRGT